MFLKVLSKPPYAARPAARQGSSAVRFWKTLFFSSAPHASIAERSAQLSSPVERASSLLTRLSVLPVVLLMPSAKVSLIRELVFVMLSVLAPQYMQTMCSTHTLSIVSLTTLEKSNTFPGPSIRDV